MSDQTVTFNAISFESLALEEPLRFPAPMADRGSSYESFEFHWKLLLFVFDLEDPALFPPLAEGALLAADLAVLRRFCRVAEDLSSSLLLASSARVTVQVDRRSGTEVETVVKSDYPGKDVVAGFLALFRQAYSTKERASFTRVYGLLEKASQANVDSHSDIRRVTLGRWRKAHGHLRNSPLLALVAMKLMDDGRMIRGTIPEVHDLNPEELISIFAYGDLLHWGEKRDDLDAFGAGKLGAIREHDFLKVVSGIAHFYSGFALLALAAAGDTYRGSQD